MRDDENMTRLREITQELQPPVGQSVGKGVISFPVEVGTVLGWPIFCDEQKVAVLRVFASKGTVYPKHSHDQHEIVMVYEGVMLEVHDGKKRAHTPEDNPCVSLATGEPHEFEFPEDTWMVVTTIPKAPEWPDEPD